MEREDSLENFLLMKSSIEQRMSKLATTIYERRRFNLKLQPESITKEIESFLKTGNFEPIDSVACLNPTLLAESLREVKYCWDVDYLTCPFDAFFPISFKDQMASDMKFDSAYSYCKTKLQSLVSELQSRKSRIVFHFYFCDWIEKCLFGEEQKFKNEFHVIHCADLADRVGLANVLVATNGCLIQDDPDALLLTETSCWVNHHVLEKEDPSVAEYVEQALCCPLTMIPTFYGLRQIDHLDLGSPACIQVIFFCFLEVSLQST